MRNLIVVSLVLLAAVSAFGHAGEIHNYMGTVITLHDDGSFIMKTTDEKTIHVHVAKTTKYLHADGHTAKRAEVVAGKRVVVTISKDGKTASTIKLAAAEKPQKK